MDYDGRVTRPSAASVHGVYQASDHSSVWRKRKVSTPVFDPELFNHPNIVGLFWCYAMNTILIKYFHIISWNQYVSRLTYGLKGSIGKERTSAFINR